MNASHSSRVCHTARPLPIATTTRGGSLIHPLVPARAAGASGSGCARRSLLSCRQRDRATARTIGGPGAGQLAGLYRPWSAAHRRRQRPDSRVVDIGPRPYRDRCRGCYRDHRGLGSASAHLSSRARVPASACAAAFGERRCGCRRRWCAGCLALGAGLRRTEVRPRHSRSDAPGHRWIHCYRATGPIDGGRRARAPWTSSQRETAPYRPHGRALERRKPRPSRASV